MYNQAQYLVYTLTNGEWHNLVMAACMVGFLEIAIDAKAGRVSRDVKNVKCMLMLKLFLRANILKNKKSTLGIEV